MGERKRRREAFFAKNPKCCFCGGSNVAKEIDHQPPKIFFIKKASSRLLRFPACSNCNRSSRILDQVIAFYSRLDATGYFTSDFSEMNKIIDSFNNNYPTLKPYFIDAKTKKKVFRDLGLAKPKGKIWSEVPVVEFNPNVFKLLKLGIAKIGIAMYYQFRKIPASLGANIIVIIEKDISILPSTQLQEFKLEWQDFSVFQNNNELSQQQFGVKISYHEDESLFLCHMRLNASIVATVVVAENELEGLEVDYRIEEVGFPWGADLDALLKGKPEYMYYSSM